jgi:hypothetical protein
MISIRLRSRRRPSPPSRACPVDSAPPPRGCLDTSEPYSSGFQYKCQLPADFRRAISTRCYDGTALTGGAVGARLGYRASTSLGTWLARSRVTARRAACEQTTPDSFSARMSLGTGMNPSTGTAFFRGALPVHAVACTGHDRRNRAGRACAPSIRDARERSPVVRSRVRRAVPPGPSARIAVPIRFTRAACEPWINQAAGWRAVADTLPLSRTRSRAHDDAPRPAHCTERRTSTAQSSPRRPPRPPVILVDDVCTDGLTPAAADALAAGGLRCRRGRAVAGRPCAVQDSRCHHAMSRLTATAGTCVTQR